MLQEVAEDDYGHRCPELPSRTRTKQRSLDLADSVLFPDSYMTKRQCPKFQINQLHYLESTATMEASPKRQMIWIMIRMMMEGKQQVAGWAGFISETGLAPAKLTTIDCNWLVDYWIIEYKNAYVLQKKPPKRSDRRMSSQHLIWECA